MWGYGEGWQEAEFNQALGVWRWASDRCYAADSRPRPGVRITHEDRIAAAILREAPLVRVRAGDSRDGRGDHHATTANGRLTCPGDALSASSGAVTIETDKTFVPAGRGSVPDKRHLGLRVF